MLFLSLSWESILVEHCGTFAKHGGAGSSAYNVFAVAAEYSSCVPEVDQCFSEQCHCMSPHVVAVSRA